MSDTALFAPDHCARRDLAWCRTLLLLSVMLALLALGDLVIALGAEVRVQGWGAFDSFLFLLACLVLLFGGVVHQLARLGLAQRRARATRLEASPPVGGQQAPVTILVPAYKEEPGVVLRTLLSAILQTYPTRRVVLLLDDPPAPAGKADQRRLAAMRAMPERIDELLAPLRHWIATAGADFRARRSRATPGEEGAALVCLADALSFWLDSLSDGWAGGDHEERFFAEAVLRRTGRLLRQRARAAVARTEAAGPAWWQVLDEEHQRLAALVTVELSVFERKRFANLSHAANKAMNLNSYIACMGRRLAERDFDGTLQLVDTADGENLAPASPFVLTLDADSILLPEYTERLVAEMARPGNERLAVLQTPYATFPGASSPLERIAGATTDIQLLLHQGYSRYGATFWVGANALIRKAALDDIAVRTIEDGREVVRYVQDRTVIEDTESTLDLVGRGWRLGNHPERLAYSATPPDFGALVIQRRRWACGGLLVLPKLLRQAMSGSAAVGAAEFAIRFHYLASLAYGPAAVLLMLLFPFEDGLAGFWLPLTATPYFLAYGRDLVALGYRWHDLPRVYALNLLLLPVQLAGTLASLRQAITGRKTPFKRTPKVAGRTSAPRALVLVAWGLPAWCIAGAVFDLWLGNAAQAGFAGLNGILFGYACLVFVGVRSSLADLVGARFGRLVGPSSAPTGST